MNNLQVTGACNVSYYRLTNRSLDINNYLFYYSKRNKI